MSRFLRFAALFALLPASAGAQTAQMVRGACGPKRSAATPSVAMPSRANALTLLDSVTQLRSAPRGRAVLAANLATTVAINNTASPAVRRQALRDAQVTAANAFALGDGLGETMSEAYWHKATFTSANDGKAVEAGQVGPAVAELFKAAVELSGGDSGEAKCAFANGVEPFQGGTFVPPKGGVLDVFGRAYDLPPGAPGGDPYGNPRPFQTARPGAGTGLHIETYEATDFFGVPMSSRVVLFGSTPEDLAAGRYARSLEDSPSYPSGHTTFAYTEGLLLAMMIPERYRALVYRASEYGNSRIVVGAHYALDVIAGRTLATYDLAQDLAGKAGYAGGQGTTFVAKLAAAARELRAYLRQNGCPSLAVCAAEPIERASEARVIEGNRPKPASPGQAYTFRLHYGLPTLGHADEPPDVMPVAAGFLLSTRFPYLTPEQRSDVLRSTEGPSGHFLDVDPTDGAPIASLASGPAAQAGAYSRIDLFAAAGGYGSFSDRVVVEQDPTSVSSPDLQPFADLAKADTWSNDIAGPGGLTKRGSGRLVLRGRNSYAAPTLIEGGTLEIAGSVASATTAEAGGTLAGAGTLGDVFVLQGGTLAPGPVDGHDGAPMTISGSLALAAGSTLVVAASEKAQLAQVEGHVILDAPKLVVKAKLKAGDRVRLLSVKDGVIGRFGSVALADPQLDAKLDYAPDAVTMTVVPKNAPGETPH